ncbi:MAG TPA: alkaline phosphatase family protein [Thermoanaerobaculia bacterium]|nr:alkaline phosphatase family protein [Thermoanaerobaculia bacterium]
MHQSLPSLQCPRIASGRRLRAARLLAAAVLVWLIGGPAAAAPAASGPGASRKLVILGFDGADAKLTRKWMDEGKLPNLAKLAKQGSFAPLLSTIPSQTPVSWSTFSTGLNPGRHGIFDFLKRDPQTYRPSFAAFDEKQEPFLWGKSNGWIVGAIAGVAVCLLALLAAALLRRRRPPREGRREGAVVTVVAALLAGIAAGAVAGYGADRMLPKQRPVAFNRQRGDTFWAILGHAGKRVRVMRVPVTFPPKPYEEGQLLSGLGVPDLSKRIGKPFYFTSELFFTPKGGGDFKVEVVELPDNKGVIDTEIKEIPNDLFPGHGDFISIPMRLSVAPDRGSVRIQVSGNDLSLKAGEWSGWVRFVFPFNSLIKVHGIGRFRVLSVSPELRLYLSPIQLDPEKLPPGLAITTPASFVDRLTGRFGLFKTIGWQIDTWSLTDGTTDEQVFLEDVQATVDKDREMLRGQLADDDWDVLVQYFEFTDRVQHMMFRFLDPKHPLYTAEGARRWGPSVLQAYQQMDAIVGETMAKMPANAALMVLSDHGFASFRRGMNYNTWLATTGLMTLTGEDSKRMNLEDLFGQGDFFVNVDWSKTKAYALGLGQIYINLAGREGKGIVQPGAEYRKVEEAIRSGLEAYVDPATGEHPVAHVFTREEAYGTFDPELIPDLIPSNNEGYRVGWQDTLGGIGKNIVEPNDQIWSGDHCSVYPPLVKGILFTNFKLSPASTGSGPGGASDANGASGTGAAEAKMGDVMPTILDLYGVQPTERLDGKSLLPPHP